MHIDLKDAVFFLAFGVALFAQTHDLAQGLHVKTDAFGLWTGLARTTDTPP